MNDTNQIDHKCEDLNQIKNHATMNAKTLSARWHSTWQAISIFKTASSVQNVLSNRVPYLFTKMKVNDASCKKQSNSSKQLKKKIARINVWSESQILNRIKEIETTLQDNATCGQLSKARKKLLRKRVVQLKKALEANLPVGGQLLKKIRKPRSSVKNEVVGKKKSKKECLCCRKRGHTLQECRYNPDALKSEDSHKQIRKTTDEKLCICFNCGSSCHTLKNCSAPRKENGFLPFASCFVCSEKGHLSQTCPRNKTGIYPHGGSCLICESTLHLMRDCPNRRQVRGQD